MPEDMPIGFHVLNPDQSHEIVVLEALRIALGCLLERDGDLMVFAANERSICHRLAIYLECELRERGCDLAVDCEYNRVASSADAGVYEREMIKRLGIGEEGRPELVYPDIIVHDRSSADRNELVIEAKRNPSRSWGDRSFDFDKLRLFVSELRYRNAVFLEFRGGTTPNAVAICLDGGYRESAS